MARTLIKAITAIERSADVSRTPTYLYSNLFAESVSVMLFKAWYQFFASNIAIRVATIKLGQLNVSQRRRNWQDKT